MKNEIAKFNIPGVGEAFLAKGIEDNLIDELIKISTTDPLVIKNTSDPKRFANREAYDEWIKKGSTIYTLTDESGSKLLGFFWIGFRPFTKANKSYVKASDYNFSAANRIYGNARGKGMNKTILGKVLEDYIASEEYKQHATQNQGGFWIETSKDNYPNLKTYTSLGFRLIAHNSSKGKVQLVADDEDILECSVKSGCEVCSGEEKMRFVECIKKEITVLPEY